MIDEHALGAIATARPGLQIDGAQIGHILRTDDVEAVVGEIIRCDVLLTEAMHGAIIADAYRIPWAPVKTNSSILDFKWLDWCASLEVSFNPYRMLPLWDLPESFGHRKRIRQSIKAHVVARQFKALICRVKPRLSNAAILDARLEQLRHALLRLRHERAG